MSKELLENSQGQFIERTQCPICEAREFIDRYEFDGMRTAKCCRCEFMFTRDVLAKEAASEFYEAGYGGTRQKNGQMVNAIVNVALLKRLGISLAEKSVLDVGAGYGFFLAEARRAGAKRVVGIEPSVAECTFATKALSLDMRNSFGSLQRDDQFDIVTAFEVIEHISEPIEFLRSVGNRVKRGGSVIIGTDNFESEVVRKLGREFPKWIPHEHVSLFAPATLTAAVESVGLSVVGTRSFTPWELRLREALFKLSNGRRGGKTFKLEREHYQADATQYRLFKLRKVANRVWFNITNRKNLSGEMMYAHAKKLFDNEADRSGVNL
jgi:2-polyprenyl-3-methyl-5-hydroxy-6-metoxy-1,4-benzoquinol methylase